MPSPFQSHASAVSPVLPNENTRVAIPLELASRRSHVFAGGATADPDFTAPDPDVTISPDASTASKSLPFTRPSCWSTSLFQRASGTPDMNHGEPLSATITP